MRFIGICAAVVVATAMASVASCSSSDSGGGNNGSPDSGPKPAADAGVDANSSSGDDGGGDASDLPPTPPAWDQPITQPTDTAAQTGRASCTFKAGDMPATTLGTSTPLDAKIPIDNIVVVVMENRSFDSMLGHMNEDLSRTDIEEAPANSSNPDAPGSEAGATHPYMHAPHMCFTDTDHGWRSQHLSYDNGANDGFYASHNGTDGDGNLFDGGPEAGVPTLLDGERAMWWYDNTDIPFEYSLANSYAVADHYFCSTLGPTYPNRDFLVSATSFGQTENGFPTFPTTDPNDIVNNRIITDELEQRHASWAAYTDGTPGLATVLNIGIVKRYPIDQTTHFALQDFLDAAKNGTMPQVAFVDPKIGVADSTPTNDDQHPPSDVQIGSFFLQEIVKAVTTSPQWAHTALFITWDENGGEYDHVPPPTACAPDTTAPILTGSDVGVSGDYTRLGFRVPLIVVSPYAKKGYVGHNVYDHTSITRFIEAKFKIPAMTARDANADPLMDMFDFSTPALLTPPTLATPVEDDAGLQYCTTTF